jgi:hypothetical protein
MRQDEMATGERLFQIALENKWGHLNPLDYYAHLVTAIAGRRIRRGNAMRAWAKGPKTGVVWGPGGHRWMSTPLGYLRHVRLYEVDELFADLRQRAVVACDRLTQAESGMMTREEERVCNLLVSAKSGDEYVSIFTQYADLIWCRGATKALLIP